MIPKTPFSRGSLDVRLAVSPLEAADLLGVSRSYFYEEIYDELRVVRRGRKRLIPVSELHAWLDRNASRLP